MKDVCLQKIKAKFWVENLLSMHILWSSVLSSFLKGRAWLRKTNEESILEKCAQGGKQDCTRIDVMFCFWECLPRISQMFYSREKHYCSWHWQHVLGGMLLVEIVQFRDLHTCHWDQQDTGNNGLFYRMILNSCREISNFLNSFSSRRTVMVSCATSWSFL